MPSSANLRRQREQALMVKWSMVRACGTLSIEKSYRLQKDLPILTECSSN